jgi:hypothetical protein
LKDLAIDKTVIKWILKKYNRRAYTGLTRLRAG